MQPLVMQTRWDPTRDSIFGDTYGGVPNPLTAHQHPWPTRFHGPNFTVPGTANPTYRERDYAKAPYMGVGAVDLNVTGAPVLDAAAGAAIGYFMAPRKEDKIAFAIGGGIASLLAGWMGMAGTAGFALYSRK